MHSEIESFVWLSVQKVCDAAEFEALIRQVVDRFKRDPGFDPLVRLHVSDIGPFGIEVLGAILRNRGHHHENIDGASGYLQLRSRLREHLCNELQGYLVTGGHATEEVQVDLLERDLGL